MPLAYLLTWTTYGTWLHGDQRGSVDDLHNEFGKPYAEAREARRAARHQQLAGKPVTLDGPQRDVVRDTIRKHCGLRKWRLHDLNVRTNHVHMIVSAPTEPERVMSQCKGWCTRLLREGRLVDPEQEVWTEGGSRRYIWNEDQLARARDYVRNQQGPDI